MLSRAFPHSHPATVLVPHALLPLAVLPCGTCGAGVPRSQSLASRALAGKRPSEERSASGLAFLLLTHLSERKRKSFTCPWKVTKPKSGLFWASFHQFCFSCALVRNLANYSTRVCLLQFPVLSLPPPKPCCMFSLWNRMPLWYHPRAQCFLELEIRY